MSLTDEEKKAQIEAKRGPLEHELYGAELDLKTAEAGGNEALIEGPKGRVESLKKQLQVLEDEEKELG